MVHNSCIAYSPFKKNKKIKLLQKMAIFPFAVQYILLVVYFINSSLYLLTSYPYLAPLSYPLPTGNH